MSRNLAAEAEIKPEAIAQIEASWGSFANTVKTACGSIAKLHSLVLQMGYNIKRNLFYEQVEQITKGAGLLQNPVLLNLVCKVTSQDLNLVFGLIPKDATVIELSPRTITEVASEVAHQVTLSKKLEQETKRTKSLPAGSPAQSWVERLFGIMVDCGSLTQGIYRFPVELPERSFDFGQRCLKPFPQRDTIFIPFRFHRLFLRYVNEKLTWRNQPVSYFYAMLSFAGIGYLQTFRTLVALANRRIVRGPRYSVNFESSEVEDRFWQKYKQLSKQIASLNEILSQDQVQLTPSMEVWNGLANLNWRIMQMWYHCFLWHSNVRLRNLDSENETESFIRDFISTSKDPSRLLVEERTIFVDQSWLSALQQITDIFQRFIESFFVEFQTPDLTSFFSLCKVPQLTLDTVPGEKPST